MLSWNSTLKRFEFNQNLYLANAPTSPASTTLRVAAVSGQTGALTNWLDSSGNVLSTVTAGGFLGIGTTSPYALLSISNNLNTAVNTPLFAIASTTAGTATSTLLTVLASGNMGIGTSSPGSTLAISNSNASVAPLSIYSASSLTATTHVYTANATWTKPANLDHVVVYAVGAGGAGGGQASGAGGGGGGSTAFGTDVIGDGGGGGGADSGSGGGIGGGATGGTGGTGNGPSTPGSGGG
ncbi:MAG: hypothetical protein NTY93_02395, partial [Candidatus Kaiserbacteria bacterium]|nr:hypothetical protein [Candidatus Kaiserbacteria bacterium]